MDKYIWMGQCHTYERVWSILYMRHVTHMNASCCIHECVMSYIWGSHVTLLNASCRKDECVMWYTWTSHVAHMNESSLTCEGVMSLQVVRTLWFTTYECEVACMNMSCHTYERVMSHYECEVTHMDMSRHTWRDLCECVMSHMLITCWLSCHNSIPSRARLWSVTLCLYRMRVCVGH